MDETRPTLILVVEDEHLLRATSVEAFQDAGLEVVEAHNVTEAIRVLSTHDNVGVVFTDIIMPDGPDGLELARTIRERWPSVWIIFASGQKRPDDAAGFERSLFFGKPYNHGEVIEQIREITAAA